MQRETNSLAKKLTVLVNSCDSYEDLWLPFFTLLKKYWEGIDLRIILNTEKKNFLFSGLNIDIIHMPRESTYYGERIINCLNHIHTPYTMFLLDDFFLRKPVEVKEIERIIEYMDNDKRIVSFTCNVNQAYYDWESDKYCGYKRVPFGNPYTLTMQAGIWRTTKLKRYWRPKVSPWEWEEYCNALTTFHLNDKFYMNYEKEKRFFEYGYDGKWMGVYHGKWVIEDVEPLFRKEGIKVDFEKRGVYYHDEGLVHIAIQPTIDEGDIVKRCLGLRGILGKFIFHMVYPIIPILYEPFQGDYLSFLRYRAQVKFCKKNRCYLVHVVTFSELWGRILDRLIKK